MRGKSGFMAISLGSFYFPISLFSVHCQESRCVLKPVDILFYLECRVRVPGRHFFWFVWIDIKAKNLALYRYEKIGEAHYVQKVSVTPMECIRLFAFFFNSFASCLNDEGLHVFVSISDLRWTTSRTAFVESRCLSYFRFNWVRLLSIFLQYAEYYAARVRSLLH